MTEDRRDGHADRVLGCTVEAGELGQRKLQVSNDVGATARGVGGRRRTSGIVPAGLGCDFRRLRGVVPDLARGDRERDLDDLDRFIEQVGRVGSGRARRRCLASLDVCFAARTARMLIEQRLRALAAHHLLGDRIGMLLVDVASFANSALELDARTLLNDVCRLVGGQMKAWCAGEGDLVTGRIGVGADRVARGRRFTANVGLDPRNVVPAECALDGAGMRQRATTAGDTLRGCVLNCVAIGRRRRRSLRRPLHRRQLFCESSLPGAHDVGASRVLRDRVGARFPLESSAHASLQWFRLLA